MEKRITIIKATFGLVEIKQHETLKLSHAFLITFHVHFFSFPDKLSIFIRITCSFSQRCIFLGCSTFNNPAKFLSNAFYFLVVIELESRKIMFLFHFKHMKFNSEIVFQYLQMMNFRSDHLV